MPTLPEPTRRFTLALTAAVAATTVAIGVTAATLFGWFRPVAAIETATVSPAKPSVIYVPIAPSAPPELPAARAAAHASIVAMGPTGHEERETEDDDE